MKVKELIELLKKQNQELEVCISYWNDDSDGSGYELKHDIYHVKEESDKYNHKTKEYTKIITIS